ncbi:MAG: thiol:disulfide interchange protein DsbG [Micavibrio aeruginosavorus]|uniref:Thiol:disulfide interchange protein DsbG n=1 Tax=Micavibrio aeruginosavorus TaxID=349221 RepID=A0A2W5HUL8_9BACT|nr:MAG: thiol:disulfide interchange protein DsbG [Micavibrio aeruginosavorus]
MRVFTVLPALLAVLLMFSPLSARAADPELPELLKGLQAQGVSFRYLGGDNSVNGWVGFKDGQEQYFYVTPDRQGIVTGQLLNNKGDQVTLRQIAQLREKDPAVDQLANPAAVPETSAQPVPATSSPAAEKSAPPKELSKAGQFYAEAQAASWIALGRKEAPAIYTFIDPQCPHCHDMIDDFRKSGVLEKGQVQLRLIPVGLMNEQSLKQAANLLASKDAASDLYKHLDGDKKVLLADPDPNTQNVQRNMVLMQNWKLDVTPFSLYKNKAGEIKILRGRPQDLKSLIAELK